MKPAFSIKYLRGAVAWVALAGGLAGCETGGPVAVATAPAAVVEPGVTAATDQGPAGAPEGTCWGRTVSPAVVETVDEQVLVKPAQVNPDGTVSAPPEYRSENRQRIVTARVDNWFETPCPEALTPEFIGTLQRALTARGYYAGPDSGVLDAPTRSAMRAYQTAQGGPDSPVLALETARGLGLIAVARTDTE